MWDQVKELKEVLAIFGAILIGIGFLGKMYLDWQIETAVANAVDGKFLAAGHVPPHRMKQAEEDIDKLEAANLRLDAKADRIVQILLED